MEKAAAKFVHGHAEHIREIEVESADDPPLTYSIWLPSEFHDAEDLWDAVYVRETNPDGDPKWIYRFHGFIDPEE